MSFLLGEKVYVGNSMESAQTIGTVNYKADGTLEIININGNMLKAGDLIIGEDSGYSFTINNFDMDNRVGDGVNWDIDNTGEGAFIVTDDNSFVVTQDFFSGANSAIYQQTYVIVLDSDAVISIGGGGGEANTGNANTGNANTGGANTGNTGGANTVNTISYVTHATSTASTITAPSNILSGDILVLYDQSASLGSIPSEVIPTGFTKIQGATNGLLSGSRGISSFKIANGTEASTSITGVNAGEMAKILFVLRPNFTASNVNPKSLSSQSSITDTTITSNTGSVPLVVYLMSGRGSNSFSTLSVTANHELYADNGTVFGMVKLIIYNSNTTPQAVTKTAVSSGLVPIDLSGYLEIS